MTARVGSRAPVRRPRSAGALLVAFALVACGSGSVACGSGSDDGSARPTDGSASADLYVDGRHPAASDANDGARDRPFKTLSAAIARARPGATVWVASGTYRESVSFPRGGAGPDQRIRVAAASGADVAVKGSDVVTGWGRARGALWKKTGWKVNSQQVFVDGEPLRQIGATSPFNDASWGGKPILPPTGRGLADVSTGSFFYDRAAETLYVRLRDDGDPNTHLVEASVRAHVIVATVDFVELRGLKFSHSNTSALPAMMGIVNIQASGWLVTGCSFTWGDFVGLSVSGEGHRLSDNVASDNGNLGIAINGSDAAHDWEPYPGRPPQDIVLERNETSRNNYRGFYPYYQAGGVKAVSSCNGIRITQHTAIANAGPGIWFDIGCRDATVEDSRLQDNTRGIEYEMSDGARIARNLVTGSSEQGIYVNASSGVSVVNNTLDGNTWSIVVHGVPRAEHPQLKGNSVSANIIAASRKADLVIHPPAPGVRDNTSDYNLFYDGATEGAVRIAWAARSSYRITHADLGKFADDTGQDRHSIIADPRWVDASAADYALLPGSPAIAAGPPDGQGRPCDLGAFPPVNGGTR
jgi:hypothetical protein